MTPVDPRSPTATEPVVAILTNPALPIDATGQPAEDLSRRYLALIASVADRLLAADDPAKMIEDIFALIQTELQLDLFVNYRFNGDCLILEAHGGLGPVDVEALSELALGQAVCGCVARDRVPAHVTQVQGSVDPQTDFIRALGIDAYACTPLIHGDALLGTLSFGRRRVTRFTDDELNFLQTICHYVALAKHRLRIEEDLREAVETREALLGELNHRVRNSLQLAVGLVALEAGSVGVEAERTLRRAMDRIQVLASAHRPLYGSANAGHVDLDAMLHGVFEQAMPVDTPRHYRMGIDRAVIVALLVHEITMLRPPTGLHLAIDRLGDTLQLTLDGLGDATNTPNTRLVDALARQMRATMTLGDTRATVRFPYGDA